MEIEIREIREEDVEILSAMEREIFSLPWSPSDFRDLITCGYKDCLVALGDGRVAGCAVLSDICGEGSIDKVMVAREFRGRMVGQKLLAALLELGEQKGIEAFTLEVRVSNETAIHIYTKCGFRSEGIRPRFYEKPVEDAMIMWRRSGEDPAAAGR